MDSEVKKRLQWVQYFEETQDAGLVCRRMGISRPTLRKWLRRYQESGMDGLCSESRKPLNSPTIKLTEELLELIQEYRDKRKLGARRIQLELIRNDQIRLSLATIHKVLHKLNFKPLVRTKRSKHIQRYEMDLPGERVQMDVTKINPGVYQYTAVDDCTRYRVLALYPRRTASNTIKFIEQLIEEMPFPIQRIQTDRGGEFFALTVQKMLMKYAIKFRPIKPGSPHLNGKVERSQQTDIQEFYASIDLNAISFEELQKELGYWYRPHSSLGGATPMDKYQKLAPLTPLSDEVEELYDSTQERIREQNYKLDLQISRLK